MSRHCLWAVPIVALALFAGPAVAQPQVQPAQTVTASGTGETHVTPRNRHSNASIATAVNAARKASISGALRDARENARDYAKAVGLKLGSVISVSDSQTNGYFGPGGPGGVFLGPFGPNQYCGTVRQLVGKPVKGKKLRFKKVHRCFVPRFAYTTLTVTYSAS